MKLSVTVDQGNVSAVEGMKLIRIAYVRCGRSGRSLGPPSIMGEEAEKVTIRSFGGDVVSDEGAEGGHAGVIELLSLL